MLFGLEDKISLRLSDGLDAVAAGEAQDIILAGMGGILITGVVVIVSMLAVDMIDLALNPRLRKSVIK